jgi:hydrogenase maturation protease
MEFQEEIIKLVKKYKRILFLGVGETRMSDDGFGPYIAHSLLQKNKTYRMSHVKIINGKIDYVERKREILEFQPNLLILLDTCQSNNDTAEIPGEIHLHYEENFVNWLPLSSHVLPIPVFLNELKLTLPDLKSILIGVIPFSTKHKETVINLKGNNFDLDAYEENPDLPFFGFNLTPKIQKVADELVDFFVDFLKN